MTLLRFRFPALFRFAAFAALLAMLVPVGTSLVHHPDALAQGLIRICGVEQGGGATSEKAPIQKAPSCPICQMLHLLGAGFTPPDSPILATLSVKTHVLVATNSAFIFTSTSLSRPQPRAPPRFI